MALSWGARGDSFALDPGRRAIEELLKRIGPERARFVADAYRIPKGAADPEMH